MGTVYAAETDVPVSGSVTFKPSYTADVYDITYDEAGGTAVADATAGYGEKITLADAPERKALLSLAGVSWQQVSFIVHRRHTR